MYLEENRVAKGKNMEKLALDRKVEVVSGNTPHASSASTPTIIAKVFSSIKGVCGLVVDSLEVINNEKSI